MTGFGEALQNTERKTGGLPCPVQVAHDALDVSDRAAFLAALDNSALSESQIVRALADVGVSMGYGGIPRHRRRSCKCFRT